MAIHPKEYLARDLADAQKVGEEKAWGTVTETKYFGKIVVYRYANGMARTTKLPFDGSICD